MYNFEIAETNENWLSYISTAIGRYSSKGNIPDDVIEGILDGLRHYSPELLQYGSMQSFNKDIGETTLGSPPLAFFMSLRKAQDDWTGREGHIFVTFRPYELTEAGYDIVVTAAENFETVQDQSKIIATPSERGESTSKGSISALSGAIRHAVSSENWYAALMTSLTMPDICGFIDNEDLGSRRRYIQWFSTWMNEGYGPRGRDTFLSGDDCYALRCSCLHQGDDDISLQNARTALVRFKFCAPRKGSMVHNNLLAKGVLQLQVDIFCTDIADAVDAWSATRKREGALTSAESKLLTIHQL